MSRAVNYVIHDLLSIQMISENTYSPFDDVNRPLSYFKTDRDVSPDIRLKIGRFEPSIDDCTIIDHKYHVKDNYIYCNGFSGLSRWRFEVFGFESGDVEINFWGGGFGIRQNAVPDALPQNILLRPLIELRLLEKGYVLIHGLGIEKNGFAHLFCGRGGTHKTRMGMDAVNRFGFRLIGDDRVIMGRAREILSFPVYHKTFSCRAHLNRGVTSPLDKVRIAMCLMRSRPEWSEIADRSCLRDLSIVARRHGASRIREKDCETSEAVDKLSASNKCEMTCNPFHELMLAYSFVFPESRIARYWTAFTRTVNDIVRTLKIKEIEMPDIYVEEQFAKFLQPDLG